MQTNFTAGELSPRLLGRVDIDRYRNAAETIENCVIYVHGGVNRRPGLQFLAKAKHADKRAVLIPYIFNEDQAYMLEVGDAYIRVFNTDGTQVMAGAVPYELQTSYAEADVAAIDYCQGADTMFLLHSNYVPQRLRRFALASWVVDPVPWITEPFDEIGTSPGTTLALDDATVGAGRTLTAGADTWRAADVGRTVTALGGRATITALTSGTVATATVSVAFPGTSFTAGQWNINGSPQTTLTPTTIEPNGASTTLTLSAAGWRADDVGKWVDLNGGLVQITAVSSATVATGTIHRILSAAAAAPPFAWILEGRVWGGYNGHPRTGTLYQQRLWLAGSPGFPQTIWGSRIGEYFNFELGTLDSDAVSFTIASDQLNPVVNLTQIKVLVALTYGGEFTLQGGNDNPITPTNVQVQNQSNFGCTNAAPERVGNELVFVQRAQRKVRAMSADKIVTDQYGAPDLTVLAEHITETGLTSLAYQGEPDSLIYGVRADGVLATCTIDRDQDVVGWSRQTTQGVVESVAVIPGIQRDQVWVLVRRTVNGQDVRYIERFAPDLMTDCAVVLTDATGKTAWTGLDYLEGCTVVVKGDGVALAERVVFKGAITTERPVKRLEVGLKYTPRVKALRPAVDGQEGTSQNSNLRVSSLACRFLNTTGATINGAPAFARQAGLNVLDQPPPMVSGDVAIETLGWDIGKWDLVIEQPQPYPFHLQAIIAKLTVNS